MEARRLITATSSCFASVAPLFPFLPRGFPARWHLGMSECRHALAHPTPPHQHSAALSSQSLSFPRLNFAEIFGFRKLESLGYRVVLFMSFYV